MDSFLCKKFNNIKLIATTLNVKIICVIDAFDNIPDYLCLSYILGCD